MCVCVCVCVCVLSVIFRLYDRDGDGSLSREDVEGVMEAMYKMVSPLLAQEREEKQASDGGEGEDPSVALSARVKEMFNTTDKASLANSSELSLLRYTAKLSQNGDGEVGLDQFMEAVKEDSAITHALQHQQQLLL